MITKVLTLICNLLKIKHMNEKGKPFLGNMRNFLAWLKKNNSGASLMFVLAAMLFVMTLCSMTLVLATRLSNTERMRHETDQTAAYVQSSKQAARELYSDSGFKDALNAALGDAMTSAGYVSGQMPVAYEFSLNGILDADGNPIPLTVKYDASGSYKMRPQVTITAVIEGETYTYSCRYDTLMTSF